MCGSSIPRLHRPVTAEQTPSHILSLSGVARRDRIPRLHKPKLHRLVGRWVRALLKGDQTRCPLDRKSILDMQNEGVCPLTSCSLAKNTGIISAANYTCTRGSKLIFFLSFFRWKWLHCGLNTEANKEHQTQTDTKKKQAEIYILLLLIPQLTHYSGSLLAAGHTISRFTSNTLAHPRSLY